MEYCGPRALPHSQFLSWPEDDQDKALAWMIDKQDTCRNCGSYPDEWVEQDENGRFFKVQPPPMYARTHSCEGCATIEHAEKGIRASNNGSLGNIRVYLSRTPPPPPLQETEDEI